MLREDGNKASAHELGRIAIKLPLPPGTMSTLYKAPDRFKDIYFSKYPVCIKIFLPIKKPQLMTIRMKLIIIIN